MNDDDLIRGLSEGPATPGLRPDAVDTVVAGVSGVRRRRAVMSVGAAFVAVAVVAVAITAGTGSLSGSDPAVVAPPSPSTSQPTDATHLPASTDATSPTTRTGTTEATPSQTPSTQATGTEGALAPTTYATNPFEGSTLPVLTWDQLGTPPSNADPTTTAPATTSTMNREGSLRAFTTPGGNIHCEVGGEQYRVNCVIAEFDYTPTPASSPCGPDGAANWGSQLVLSGTPIFLCDQPGRAQPAPAEGVLEYGQHVTDGTVTCSSAEDGVRCSDSEYGSGFLLSRGVADLTAARSATPNLPPGGRVVMARVGEIPGSTLTYRPQVLIEKPGVQRYYGDDPDLDELRSPISADATFWTIRASGGGVDINDPRELSPEQFSTMVTNLGPVLAQVVTDADGTVVQVTEVYEP